MELLSPMAILFPVFEVISTLAVPIYIPTHSVRMFPFPTPSPVYIVCRLFDSSHSDECEMVHHCDFVCKSLLMRDVEHLFMCLLAICMYFWRNVCVVLGLFFYWVFYISGIELHELFFHFLYINSLSVALFATMFSHSEGCLFTLLIVSFIVQNILHLIRLNLFIFAFISIILGIGS